MPNYLFFILLLLLFSLQFTYAYSLFGTDWLDRSYAGVSLAYVRLLIFCIPYRTLLSDTMTICISFPLWLETSIHSVCTWVNNEQSLHWCGWWALRLGNVVCLLDVLRWYCQLLRSHFCDSTKHRSCMTNKISMCVGGGLLENTMRVLS